MIKTLLAVSCGSLMALSWLGCKGFPLGETEVITVLVTQTNAAPGVDGVAVVPLVTITQRVVAVNPALASGLQIVSTVAPAVLPPPWGLIVGGLASAAAGALAASAVAANRRKKDEQGP